MNLIESQSKVQKIVQTGLFIAIAVILSYFSKFTSIYIGGIESIRISMAGPFAKMPALLFGPAFGAAAGGLIDIIGFILRPMGGYIPWLTLTAVLDGFLAAVLWNKLKSIEIGKVSSYFGGIFAAIGTVGVINHIIILFVTGSDWAKYIAILEKKGPYLTLVLEVIALIGLIFYFIGRIIRSKNHLIYQNFMKLLVAVGIGGLIETTLNTWILQLYFAPLAKMGFVMFWIPRLVEELAMTLVQAYLIAVLLVIYQRFKGRAFA